jgi:hypothetical protein
VVSVQSPAAAVVPPLAGVDAALLELTADVSAGAAVAALGADVLPDGAELLASLPHDNASSPSVTVVITKKGLLINSP